MKLRVALITRAFRCGGVGTFLLRLGRHLVEHGCAVDLVTTEEPGDWYDLAPTHGLHACHVAGADRIPPVLHALRVGRALASSRPDVVFLNHAYHAQLALGMLPDSVFAVPIIHSDHEEIYRLAFANPNAWNLLVAVSPRILEVAHSRLPNRPAVLIPHGVEIPQDSMARAEQKRTEPFRLAYLGRLEHSRKGVLLLPLILQECVRRGLDVRLRIAGTGPDEARLFEMMDRLDLQARVESLGPLTLDQAYQLLQNCHALLQPSFVEGFSLAMLEALACGCPPICSALPGSTTVAIDSGRTGTLVPPGNTEGFADAIARYDRDRDSWFAVCRAGYEDVKVRFPSARMGAAYLRLIEEGLNQRYPLPRRRRHSAAIDMGFLSWRDLVPPALLDRTRRWIRGAERG